MKRLLIEPTTFEVLPMQDKQNPYIDVHHVFDRAKVAEQHKALTEAIKKGTGIVYKLPATKVHLPDIVFTANCGLSLPRLADCIASPLALQLDHPAWPGSQLATLRPA